MAPLIIDRPDQRSWTGRDKRMFVESVLRIVLYGSLWRDLPDVFEDWSCVFRRFVRKGVWWRMLQAVSNNNDLEYLIVDSALVRAHQPASGAKTYGPPRPQLALDPLV